MKLISLNVWCGVKYEPLKRFIKNQSAKTDVFCLQEVRNGEYLGQQPSNEKASLFHDLEGILPDFTSFYTEMATGVGLASFVRKGFPVKVKPSRILSAEEMAGIKMSNGNSYYPRLAQSIYFQNQDLVVHNFHGIPGNRKKDTPERDLQTKRLLELLNRKDPQVIVGDFNLDLKTRAIEKLSERMKNLIAAFDIKATRNSNYEDFESLPFADYAFTSKDIKINEFKVLPDEVSDHLAIFLDFA